jgi:hypothetical protein
MEPGLLKGPGSMGVRLGVPDEESFRHVDLEFLLSVTRPDETSLINCATGPASDPEEAVRQAISVWTDTTARVGLEAVALRGEYADHFPPEDDRGVPGWHSIIGRAAGYGWATDDRNPKLEWFATANPWTELAALLIGDLDRPVLNGVRLFIGQGGDIQATEVRINGRVHDGATAALARMDWPRTPEYGTAQVFLLLVHPEPLVMEDLP